MWRRLVTLLSELPPTALVCISAWLMTMISVPVLEWVGGERARTHGVAAGVVLQAAAVLAVLTPAWGAWSAVQVAAIIVVGGWLAEYVGSHTGVPFGRYRYTDRLQPQVGDVPVVVPIAWLMMLPPAWAVAAAIGGGADVTGWKSRSLFLVISALAFTAWDLYLDPQMVKWRLWIWVPPHNHRWHYFGVPWSNYLGWFLVSALITWVASAESRQWANVGPALLAIYGLTWALEAFGQLVFWRLPGPALVGAAGMGLFVLWALA